MTWKFTHDKSATYWNAKVGDYTYLINLNVRENGAWFDRYIIGPSVDPDDSKPYSSFLAAVRSCLQHIGKVKG